MRDYGKVSDDNRYELKFILDENDVTETIRWLHVDTAFRTRFPERDVCSLYFDDSEFQSVKDNLAGIANRVKTRMRWYGSNNETSVPVLEQKIREGRLGSKQQIRLSNMQDEFMDMQISSIPARIASEVGNTEFGSRVFDRNLSPSLYVRYKREYYEDHNGIRVTFDKNIKFGYIIPSKPLSALTLVSYPYRVMEIKFPPEMKRRVADLIRGLHLVPKRHSKYLAGLAVFGQVTYI